MPLANYYSSTSNIRVTEPDDCLAEVLRRLDYKFASRSPDARANSQPGISIIDDTVAEVYALKAYEDVMEAKKIHLSNHKAFTEREVKDNIARLWKKMKGRDELASKVYRMLEKDPLYAYPFKELVDKAIHIDRALPKDPDFHLRPGYCSAKEDNIPTLGDNTKDTEDV